MANPNPKIPTGNMNAPKVPGATAPEAPKDPGAAAIPAKKEKRKKAVWQEVYPTPEAAIAEAVSRTKGPRRAFTVTFGDKVYHVVGHNEGRAGGIAFKQIGGTVEEIGRAKRAAKVVGVDGVLAAINSLPADQQEAIKAALAALAPK